jgi:uncharacterized protein (DUF4415 family)
MGQPSWFDGQIYSRGAVLKGCATHGEREIITVQRTRDMSEKISGPYKLEELRQRDDRTDWDRLARKGDFEDEDEVDWSIARLVIPEPKRAVSIRLDPDVLDFSKLQGKGYQTRMNGVLRAFLEAKKG